MSAIEMSRVYGLYNSIFLPAVRGNHLMLELTFSKRGDKPERLIDERIYYIPDRGF